MSTKQWVWMMDYCKKQSIPPAESWAWGNAKKAYELSRLKSSIVGRPGVLEYQEVLGRQEYEGDINQ